MQYSSDLIDLLETISPATLALVLAELDAEAAAGNRRRITGYKAALRTLQINVGELEAHQMIDDARQILHPAPVQTVTRRRHEFEIKRIEQEMRQRVAEAEAGRSETILRHRREINAARAEIARLEAENTQLAASILRREDTIGALEAASAANK